jgi:KaiC/GvpD/RAD55 family RecA-like ATPase
LPARLTTIVRGDSGSGKTILEIGFLIDGILD